VLLEVSGGTKARIVSEEAQCAHEEVFAARYGIEEPLEMLRYRRESSAQMGRSEVKSGHAAGEGRERRVSSSAPSQRTRAASEYRTAPETIFGI